MKKVLIAAPISASFQDFLKRKEYELIQDHDYSVEGIVTSTKLVLTKETLQLYTQLKWVARLGSGMEIIDIDYCKQHHIACFSSPEGIANAVAEHSLGLLLSLLHRIPHSFDEIKHKQWLREVNRGTELQSLQVGIIGYGHTGSAVVKKLSAFVDSVMVYDKYKKGFGHEGIQEVSLQELQSKADVISFHVPLNSETRYYYDDEFLAKTKPHILMNTSRGEVCRTQTIIKGLKSRQISGACLDVLEEEKNIQEILQQADNPIKELLSYPVILTPHIAGYSYQAIEKMSKELMDQLETIL